MLNFLAAIGSAPAGGGGSFESIATATGTGSSNTITFSSIPSTFQHLQIRAIVRNTASFAGPGDLNLRINGDTGANYAHHYLAGGGSSAFASGTANASQIGLYSVVAHNNNASNIMGALIIDFHDYASTTKNKTVRIFGGTDFNDTNGTVSLQSGFRNNSAAITSISLIAANGSWNTQTTFALYGIKGA